MTFGKEMLRFFFFLVLSSLASAQKTDAVIPSISFPFAYMVSCAGIVLPADAFLLRVTVIAKDCDGVGLRVVPSAWRSIFSERDGERRVTLYPSGSAKLDQRHAVAGLFDQAFLVYPREVDDDWIDPVVTLEIEYWALGKGSMVVKINKFRVVGKILEPNQSSEPTPTSVTTPAAQEIAPAAVVAHL